MGVLEVALLIAGVVIAVLSFVLPVRKDSVGKETRELAKEEIRTLVEKEMDGIRSHVDDVVDEAVGYAVEKTERSLERLTNEKIMAVNEYSDTVLGEIRKNHEETMFLYDMLNDKHTNLKNTVSEVNKTVQEVVETRKEAEAMVNSFQQLMPEPAEQSEKIIRAPEKPKTPELERPAEISRVEPDFTDDRRDGAENSNEQILDLHRQGRSNVAIARELGLGVGEVKLVIDLYKNK